VKKLWKRVKLWWHRFNHDDGWSRPYDNAVLRAKWDAIERIDRVHRMAGGYPTGEKP
jgi:hypothetical protein